MYHRTQPTTIDPAPTPASPASPTPDRGRRPPTSTLDRQVDAAWLTGVISGCVRGLLAGRRHALRTVLRARFGSLPHDLSQRLAAVDPNRIEAWLEAAATATDLGGFLSSAPVLDGADSAQRPTDGASAPHDPPQRATR